MAALDKHRRLLLATNGVYRLESQSRRSAPITRR